MRAGAGDGSFAGYAFFALLFVYGGIAVLYISARVWQRIETAVRRHYAKPAPVIHLPVQAPSLRLVTTAYHKGPAPGPYTGGQK